MSTFNFTVIGSGVTLPTRYRKPSCFLVEYQNKKILLDCGYGALNYLIEHGISPHDIDAIFVSHFHADHFADCFQVANARAVDDIYHNKEHHILHIWGPSGLEERRNLWRKMFSIGDDEAYPFLFAEGQGEYEYEDIKFELFEVEHTAHSQSVGINLYLEDKKIAYYGDLNKQNTPEFLADKMKDADIFITSAFAITEDSNLYTLDDFAQIANQAGCDHVLATHIRPGYEEHLSTYRNPIVQVASDGLQFPK